MIKSRRKGMNTHFMNLHYTPDIMKEKRELLNSMITILDRVDRTAEQVNRKNRAIKVMEDEFPVKKLPTSHVRNSIIKNRDIAKFANEQAKLDFSHCVEKMVDLEQVRKVVSLKTPWGAYKAFTKTFNSEVHAQNWEAKMSSIGYKILEVSDTNQ